MAFRHSLRSLLRPRSPAAMAPPPPQSPPSRHRFSTMSDDDREGAAKDYPRLRLFFLGLIVISVWSFESGTQQSNKVMIDELKEIHALLKKSAD